MKIPITIIALLLTTLTAGAWTQQMLMREAYARRGAAVSAAYDPFPTKTDLAGGWFVSGYYSATNAFTFDAVANCSNVHYNTQGGTNYFVEMPYGGLKWTGTPTNTLDITTAKRRLQVNGQGDYLKYPTNQTVVLWTKTTSTNRGYLISKAYGYNTAGWGVELQTDGKLRAWTQESGSKYHIYKTTSAINDGNWHQVGMMISNSSSLFILLDGAVASRTDEASAGVVANMSNIYPIIVGEDYWAASYKYTGLIDTLSIFTNTISASTLTNLFLNGKLGGRHQ